MKRFIVLSSLRPSPEAAFVFIFILFCSLQSVTAKSIVSWGEQRFDGRDFINAQFTVISAGREHSLAIKKDGSIVGCTKKTRRVVSLPFNPSMEGILCLK